MAISTDTKNELQSTKSELDTKIEKMVRNLDRKIAN